MASFAAEATPGRTSASDAAADQLVGTVFAEFIASQPSLAKFGAPLPEEGDGSGVKLWGALAEAEEATWAVLAEAAGHPRLLEFTVQACAHILQSQPTEAKAELIAGKLAETLAAVSESSRYLRLDELVSAAEPVGDATYLKYARRVVAKLDGGEGGR